MYPATHQFLGILLDSKHLSLYDKLSFRFGRQGTVFALMRENTETCSSHFMDQSCIYWRCSLI